MVSCSTWVRRGITKSVPDKVALPKAELEKVIKELKEDIDDLEKDGEDGGQNASGDSAVRKRKNPKKSSPTPDVAEDEAHSPVSDEASDDIVAKYGLDDYDDEDGEEGPAWDTVAGLTYYATNEEDPYLTIKEDDASDREDFVVKPTDNLLVVGRAAPECSILEVYVYNDSEGSLYCHHDMILPAFPLALEWINYDPGENGPGNLVAVGSMEPTIDLWDLDVVDTIEPAFVLGSKPTKRLKKKKKGTVGGHTDAVLDLSWNSLSRTALASGSADHTCGLWDLEEGKLVTLIAHQDKVQALRWHPSESETLLTGAFDEIVRLYDCRSPHDGFKKWKLDGEIERVMWNTFQPFCFYASSEKGFVFYMDSRVDRKPVFTLSAHTGAVSGLVQSSEASTCLVTASADGFLKVWDTADNKPSCVLEKNMNMGELHCLSRCPEAGFSFAVGGAKDLRVWDVREASSVRKHFCSAPGDQSDAAAHVDASLGAMSLSAEPLDSDEEDIREFFVNEMHADAKALPQAAQAGAAAGSAAAQAKRKKKKAKRRKPKQEGGGGTA